MKAQNNLAQQSHPPSPRFHPPAPRRRRTPPLLDLDIRQRLHRPTAAPHSPGGRIRPRLASLHGAIPSPTAPTPPTCVARVPPAVGDCRHRVVGCLPACALRPAQLRRCAAAPAGRRPAAPTRRTEPRRSAPPAWTIGAPPHQHALDPHCRTAVLPVPRARSSGRRAPSFPLPTGRRYSTKAIKQVSE